MEKFKENFICDDPANKGEKKLSVDIFRHGKTDYNQKKTTPIEEARDLTPEAIRQIKASAEQLADMIGQDEEVAIWSSPLGRTLHTAKTVSNVLQARGIKLRKKGIGAAYGIKVFKELTDIKNFSRELFIPLVEGGEVAYGGQKFFIDKKESNPKNLSGTDYYIEEEIKNIPATIKNKWPPEFIKEIEGMENFHKVTKRIMRPLSRIEKLKDKPYRVIIVTHNAMTNFIGNVYSGGKFLDLDPGKFINLENKQGKLIPTKFGDVPITQKEKELLTEYKDFMEIT